MKQGSCELFFDVAIKREEMVQQFQKVEEKLARILKSKGIQFKFQDIQYVMDDIMKFNIVYQWFLFLLKLEQKM